MSTTHRSIARLLAVGLVATPSVVSAQQSSSAKQVVTIAGATPSAMFSPGVRAGDVLYVSGQLGTKPGSPIDSTIQGQTHQALENIRAVVEAAGGTMASVVKCTVFLANVQDFGGMNQAYTQFFPKEPPARSTVAVAALVRADAKVEIECIASIPR